MDIEQPATQSPTEESQSTIETIIPVQLLSGALNDPHAVAAEQEECLKKGSFANSWGRRETAG